MKTRTGMVLLAAGMMGLLTGCATTYRVQARATDKASGALAAQVEDEVYGALVSRGYAIRKNAAGVRRTTDINLDVTRKETARLAEWRMYEGKARAEVVSGKGEVMGKKTFRAQGERSRNQEEAEESAADGLVRQIDEWLATVLPPAER